MYFLQTAELRNDKEQAIAFGTGGIHEILPVRAQTDGA
jgi:hypothetical protein